MVKAGRLMCSYSSIAVIFFLRKEWFIYYSLLDFGVFTFLLKMEHLSTQINADLAIFFCVL